MLNLLCITLFNRWSLVYFAIIVVAPKQNLQECDRESLDPGPKPTRAIGSSIYRRHVSIIYRSIKWHIPRVRAAPPLTPATLNWNGKSFLGFDLVLRMWSKHFSSASQLVMSRDSLSLNLFGS